MFAIFSLNISRARAIRNLFAGAALLILFVNGAGAQTTSTTDGTTPSGIAPGSPSGSYALTNLDNINLYNGNLNIALPVLQIGGRGAAGYEMTLPLNVKSWHVQKIYDPINDAYKYRPTQNQWVMGAGLSPGALTGRQLGVDYQPTSCFGGTQRPNYPTKGITTLTFVSSGETEQELRDLGTNGQPLPQVSCFVGASRGTVFATTDGSAVTFVSDTAITDQIVTAAQTFYPSGYLLSPNGTRYRIDSGRVSWIRDRNGNRVTFAYDTNSRLSTITDSLSRQITLTYGGSDPAYYTDISYKGFGGIQRTIRVNYTTLSNALRSGYAIQTYGQLFPELYSSAPIDASISLTNNPSIVSSVRLPDGRQYQFLYDSYGEPARIVLPTGGAIEYDMVPGSGVVSYTPTNEYEIFRRVAERRVYPDGSTGTTFESRTTFTASTNNPFDPKPWYTNVTVDHLNQNGTLLAREKHYFNGSGVGSLFKFFTNVSSSEFYSPWLDGKEFQTEALDTSGNVLRRAVNVWQQRAPVSWWTGPADYAPANDPRVVETDGTLVDTNQVSKQTFSYDQYNNRTDAYEYDYGAGVPGPLVRRSHTDYLTTNPVNGLDYTGTNIHIRSLPTTRQIFDASGIERSRTSYEYDNYTTDPNHAALVDRPGISGFDSTFTTGYTTRGDVTGVTGYLLTNGSVTGSITSYAQFDIAGHVVNMIDPRGCATTLDFSDRFFGAPDGEARSNAPPLELSSQGRSSYAFPTLVNNCMGHAAYAQFDYYTGRPVDGEDANGIVSSLYYNDLLDRLTQVIRAANNLVAKSQTSFSYDDPNRVITTTSDQNTFNDANPIKSQTLYDGLGRTIEARQYEGLTNYIAVQKQYDALGRAFKTSNPFRPWNSESPIWTTASFDALSRVVSVTTPDSAVVSTSYSGNTVTVTDQTGKQRKSVSDALGRLAQVYEAPNDPNYNYLTSYGYDVLDSLLTVNQGSQTRTFVYDSLKRLASATNPESGTISYQYDNNGNLQVKTDARGVSAHYDYDALNRAIRRWYNGSSSLSATTNNSPALPAGVGASDEVKYFYDSQTLPTGAPAFDRGYATGRLVAMTYGGGSAGNYFGYDALGKPLRGIQQTGAVNYQVSALYNLAGALTVETYPSGRTVNYNYDQAGRLADKDASNLAFTGSLGDGTQRTYSSGIIYSSLGGLAKEQLGTATPIYNKLFYNVRGQLAEIRESTSYTGPTDTNWNRGAIINHYSNNCLGMCSGQSMTDNNGNVKKQEHWVPDNDQVSTYSTFTAIFTYDSLNRLQAVNESKYVNGSPTGTPTYSQSYTIDRWGNRTISQATGGVNGLPFNVDPSTNRLTAPTGYTMTYDNAGNLTNDTYTGQGQRNYDAENRMMQAWANNQWQTYTYDGDGRRVKRNVNGIETWQVYGLGGEPIAEYAANATPSSPQKEYGYRNGQLLITAEAATASAPPPTALAANPPTSGANVTLNWTAASGATSYRVERKSVPSGGLFGSIGTTPSTTMTDSGASSGSAYLYKVCAADGAGNCISGYSNIVLGAPFNFPTDPTITSIIDDPTGITVTTMKAAHITELRTAVNAVRALAGLSAATWTNPNIAYGVAISVDDVRDLRTKLGEALSALGIQTPTYTDSTIKGFTEDPLNATPIRAAHIRELRLYATRGIGGSGGGGTSFAIRWLVSDQLGTPRMIFDQTGNLANVSRHDYLPFGEELTAGTGGRTTAQGYSVGDGVRQHFTQKERDNETGLDYFGARYFASTQGRFTSPDVFGSRRRSPQSWNRYSYVLNNPLRYHDPLGFLAQDPQNPKIDPEDIIKIVIHDKHPSLLKRIFGKIGSLFKGGSRVQSEEGEPEEGRSEETKGEERKADEKDLYERQPGMDPNGVPPVQTSPDVIAPGLEDPSEALDMEEGFAFLPRLNGETPAEQLRDALDRVTRMEGSPEAKAEMFARFGAQIRVRSGYAWNFGSQRGTDGSHIFLGRQGELLVISPQGQLFRGSVQSGGLRFDSAGNPTPVYTNLKPR